MGAVLEGALPSSLGHVCGILLTMTFHLGEGESAGNGSSVYSEGESAGNGSSVYSEDAK